MTKRFLKYWLLAFFGVLAASGYPLYMAAKVIAEMLARGTVAEENYPQYLIPYAPICLALLAGTGLMPLCRKWWGRRALLGGSGMALGVFFIAELCFEKGITVTGSGVFSVDAWQLAMCALPRWDLREWMLRENEVRTPIELLIGSYNPAFKLHFYMISAVLILAILNCLYRFPGAKKGGERRALVLQAACALIFLGLCVLACLTAFWRGVYLNLSPLSASLMAAFFILLGVTAGIYLGSLSRVRRLASALAASACTAAMYAGEMILLHGNLYTYGSGAFFRSLPHIRLAPVDLAIILAAGALTALALRWARADGD